MVSTGNSPVTETTAMLVNNLDAIVGQNHTEQQAKNGNSEYITRRVDWRILPTLCLMYILSSIDRSNIGYAKLYGLEEALKLTSSQFGWTLSIYFVGYMLFQIPSNFLLKRMTPGPWFSFILTGWGLTTIFTASTKDYMGLLFCRFTLGLFEAGLFPGLIFCTGLWYTRNEQGARISLLTSSPSIAGSISGLMAYAIHGLDGQFDLQTWQWLFIIEGLPTVLLGLLVWKILPSTPHSAKFLTLEERQKLITRLESDHAELNIQSINLSHIREVIFDYKVYLYIIAYTALLLPGYATGLFLPTLVHSLGFSTLPSILLTIPPNLCGLIYTILWGRRSDVKLERGYHIVFSSGLAILGFVILISVQSVLWRYFGLILINGGLASGIALTVSWLNNNFVGTTRSAIASPLLGVFGCFGGILGGQAYGAEEAPYYIKSNMINIGCLTLVVLISLLLKWLLNRENLRLSNSLNQQVDLNKLSIDESNNFRYIL